MYKSAHEYQHWLCMVLADDSSVASANQWSFGV